MLAIGEGATSDPMKGKPHAGTVFQTSWIVGLLWSVSPMITSCVPIEPCFASRMSMLSTPKLPSSAA